MFLAYSGESDSLEYILLCCVGCQILDECVPLIIVAFRTHTHTLTVAINVYQEVIASKRILYFI